MVKGQSEKSGWITSGVDPSNFLDRSVSELERPGDERDAPLGQVTPDPRGGEASDQVTVARLGRWERARRQGWNRAGGGASGGSQIV